MSTDECGERNWMESHKKIPKKKDNDGNSKKKGEKMDAVARCHKRRDQASHFDDAAYKIASSFKRKKPNVLFFFVSTDSMASSDSNCIFDNRIRHGDNRVDARKYPVDRH